MSDMFDLSIRYGYITSSDHLLYRVRACDLDSCPDLEFAFRY